MVVLEGEVMNIPLVFFSHAGFSRTESVVETLIQYFIGTGLLTR